MPKQEPQSAVHPAPQVQKIDKSKIALDKLKAIQNWSPRELYDHLGKVGYIGQEETRRKLCLMAYRHIRRLKDHFLNNIPLNELPPKSNVLMLGPTGCGKTFLAELLFGQILQVPVVTFDMTNFVETGYVGKYVSEILFDLQTIAGDNPYWAKMGICILDEFDKIASSGSNLNFGGGGTTKDVSGYGVQRGLLKLMEGGTHEVTSRGPWGHQAQDAMETDCISFVACGAFSGINDLMTREQRGDSFGFRATTKGNPAREEGKSEDFTSVELLNWYGFLPELMGRFSAIACLKPLGKKDLKEILQKNVLPRYKQEFEREGQKLSVPKNVIEGIVDKAMVRKTGARGLAFLLTEHLEKYAFECFGQNNNHSNGEDDIPF